MKKLIFAFIIITVLFYDGYQVKFYFDTKSNLEKELNKKSERISNIIKFFIKGSIEKNYELEELFYKAVFAEFDNFKFKKEDVLVLDTNFKEIDGTLSFDIQKYKSKLKLIIDQKIRSVEIENNGKNIIIGGYKNNSVYIAKIEIPQEILERDSIDDFKKSIMEGGDVKKIEILNEERKIESLNRDINCRVIKKEFTVNDTINDDLIKYYTFITFDVTRELKSLNKNLTDIIFSLAMTTLVIILLGIYIYLNGKYMKTKEFIKEKEKDILVGSVASGVAHEIRNPLNSINYIIEYMKALTKDENMKTHLAMIKEEINRIEKSLKEFLDIRKEISTHIEPLIVNEIIKEVLKFVKSEYDGNNIEIVLEENRVLKINGDHDRLKEVFINLLKNSKESFINQDKKIVVRIDEHEVTFADNGKGMSEEEQSKVFNLYYTTKEDGNGIGLYRSKKIIEAHNGDIKIKSHIGRGTEIILSFRKE